MRYVPAKMRRRNPETGISFNEKSKVTSLQYILYDHQEGVAKNEKWTGKSFSSCQNFVPKKWIGINSFEYKYCANKNAFQSNDRQILCEFDIE